MATPVVMPKLGMAMKKGIVTKWLKAEGDEVDAGEDLVEVSTQKINAVVPAPAGGVLLRIIVPVKGEVPVSAVLGFIGEPGEEVPEIAAPAAPAGGGKAARVPGHSGEKVMASPAARRRAKELGVNIDLVPLPEAGKRLTAEDVERFAESPAAGHASRIEPFEGIRAVIAERLTESQAATAHVTVTRQVNASGLVAERAQLEPGMEAATGVQLTYTDLLVYHCSRLLPDHPYLNASLTDQGIVLHADVDIGVAVALEGGLIVPVIRGAAALSLGEIVIERARLAEAARTGALALDELEGGTFDISNLGAFGADIFTPIIDPPQSAILGVGRIADQAAAVEGRVEVQPMMWLSLTFDHRILDGAPAALFLTELAATFEGLG